MKHIAFSFILIAMLFCSCGTNGRSSESRQARLDGRVVTDEGEANGDERLAYQKLNNDSVLHQKSFQELTVDELYELLRIRSEVFVVEQNCVYQDMDGDDQKSIHLWLTVANKVVALARVCPAGTHMKEVSIGRVITTERGKGYGKQIMLHAIEAAKEHFDAKQIDIEAQEYAKGFYESVGFKQSSETFMLDGIPHIRMTLRL